MFQSTSSHVGGVVPMPLALDYDVCLWEGLMAKAERMVSACVAIV